jgi:hypothetical protein
MKSSWKTFGEFSARQKFLIRTYLLCRKPSPESKNFSSAPAFGLVPCFFRSYKNNLLLADIDISSCNFQFYFLQVAKCKLKRVVLQTSHRQVPALIGRPEFL